MNRTDLGASHLLEEWEAVVILASRYNPVTSTTEVYRLKSGNAYAIQQMLEDEVEYVIFPEEEPEEEDECETEC